MWNQTKRWWEETQIPSICVDVWGSADCFYNNWDGNLANLRTNLASVREDPTKVRPEGGHLLGLRGRLTTASQFLSIPMFSGTTLYPVKRMDNAAFVKQCFAIMAIPQINEANCFQKAHAPKSAHAQCHTPPSVHMFSHSQIQPTVGGNFESADTNANRRTPRARESLWKWIYANETRVDGQLYFLA